MDVEYFAQSEMLLPSGEAGLFQGTQAEVEFMGGFASGVAPLGTGLLVNALNASEGLDTTSQTVGTKLAAFLARFLQ